MRGRGEFVVKEREGRVRGGGGVVVPCTAVVFKKIRRSYPYNAGTEHVGEGGGAGWSVGAREKESVWTSLHVLRAFIKWAYCCFSAVA